MSTLSDSNLESLRRTIAALEAENARLNDVISRCDADRMTKLEAEKAESERQMRRWKASCEEARNFRVGYLELYDRLVREFDVPPSYVARDNIGLMNDYIVAALRQRSASSEIGTLQKQLEAERCASAAASTARDAATADRDKAVHDMIAKEDLLRKLRAELAFEKAKNSESGEKAAADLRQLKLRLGRNLSQEEAIGRLAELQDKADAYNIVKRECDAKAEELEKEQYNNTKYREISDVVYSFWADVTPAELRKWIEQYRGKAENFD